MKWGLRCSDLCKTSCRVLFFTSRVASFSFNANANALAAGDGTLGLLPWLKKIGSRFGIAKKKLRSNRVVGQG